MEKGLHWRNVRKIEIHSTRSTNTGVCVIKEKKGRSLRKTGQPPTVWVCLLGYTQWWVKRIRLQSIESCPTRRSYIFFSVVFEFFGWPVFSFWLLPSCVCGFSYICWVLTSHLAQKRHFGCSPPFFPHSVESSSGFASISFQVKMRKTKMKFLFLFSCAGWV